MDSIMTDMQNNKPMRSIERSIPIALLRAREAVMAHFRPLLADRGYTEQQWRVLRILNEYGAHWRLPSWQSTARY